MENLDIENFIAIITKGIEADQIISMSTKKHKNNLLFRLKVGKKSYRREISKEDYKSFIFLLGNRAFVSYTKGKSNEDNENQE